MYLMMVTNGENMARKLSRIVFIPGLVHISIFPLHLIDPFLYMSELVSHALYSSQVHPLALPLYALFLYLNLGVGSDDRYTIFFFSFSFFRYLFLGVRYERQAPRNLLVKFKFEASTQKPSSLTVEKPLGFRYTIHDSH